MTNRIQETITWKNNIVLFIVLRDTLILPKNIASHKGKDAGDWVSACRKMAIVGNAEKGRMQKRWNEVVKDDLKKCGQIEV